MRKKKFALWHAQLKTLIKSMKFSDLNEETRHCATHEMLFYNKRWFSVLAWSVLAIEVFNLANVLFLSRSGLASVNNRQYFAMYLLLLAGACVCLVTPRLLQRKLEVLRRFHVGFMMFWVLWCAVLSAMDLRRNPDITVFITGIFVLACLARLRPWESISILAGGLIVLLSCAWSDLTKGGVINTVIVVLTAMLISVSRYFSTLEEIQYRRKLVLQAEKQTEDKEKLTLYLGQQRALLNCSREILFFWNGETKALTTSDREGAALLKEEKYAVAQWLEAGGGEKKGMITPSRNEESAISHYQIEAFWQLNSDNAPVGAAGRLTPIPRSQIKRGAERSV